MDLKDIELIQTDKNLYSHFNSFILSKDTKTFNKLVMRSLLLDKVKNVPGDIIECGVFKGTGLLTFLKLKKLLMPNSYKKVLGFDFFNSDELINSLSGQDKEAMEVLFKQREFEHKKEFSSNLADQIMLYGFDKKYFDPFSSTSFFNSSSFAQINSYKCKSFEEFNCEENDPETYNSLNKYDKTDFTLFIYFSKIVDYERIAKYYDL
jgi:hypothetical protein